MRATTTFMWELGPQTRCKKQCAFCLGLEAVIRSKAGDNKPWRKVVQPSSELMWSSVGSWWKCTLPDLFVLLTIFNR